MPIYIMPLLHMQRVVRLRLEQIQRDFLWDGGTLEQKPHLVKWAVVCSNKRRGGLGIGCFSFLNRAFLLSGVGALQMKAGLFGSKLSVESMGYKKGGGVP